jgi:hypothetical protein
MATLILSAAGAAVGAAIGGPVGALAGRAAGGVAGAMIDQRLLGAGGRAVDTGRPPVLRVQGGREGAPIARVFGRMRVTGHIIWSSRFQEITERIGGGKGGGFGGGPSGVSRRYAISLAVALCEGPIDRLGRVWADGKALARGSVEMRLHRGGEDQSPDPLIAALEGEAPAYRGVAYAVFEALDLAPFGNRIPQLSFEVFRHPRVSVGASAEIGPPLSELVRGVALSPGSGEFSLETVPVRRRLSPGVSVTENVNGIDGRPDIQTALDQLEEEAPSCRSVLLLSTWYGDDLRCVSCRIQPRVETRDKVTEPLVWRVGGIGREDARVVGRRDDRPVFGGTPSDSGVVAAIRELRARGLRVVFYPFIMMDVPPGSGSPDPWGGAEQAAYPWRGRITASVAPGLPGSPDGSPLAAAEVGAFFGAAAPTDFAAAGDTVTYSGPDEWSLRRFVLHYAHLCALAGGVDAFCIGSELRGLTTLRAGPGVYPAVSALRTLAQDVRAVLGAGTKIGYAADWTEYFGHHPQDGSGDVVFHLDPLWADPAIDFVGIDNYMPVADWRDEPGHLDEAVAPSGHSLAYLSDGIARGEGWDWFYANAEDRLRQRRTPIADGAHGEPWVFRYKDIESWWSQPHHDRIRGARSAEPTAWAPMSKPIWFTELGCPAVDKGANQPNVFVDPKSSESGLPYFSTGARDDAMQRRFLQAVLAHWSDPARNPVSPLYGGPMVDPEAIHVWTWDARPWPEFPRRTDVWADGGNHRLGHWINGRLAAPGLAEVVLEICAEAGVAADVDGLVGTTPGYLLDVTQTARQALQPLMLAYGFDAHESGGRVRFVMRGGRSVASADRSGCVERLDASEGGGAAPTVTRAALADAPAVVRLTYLDAEGDYETRTASVRGAAAASHALGVVGADYPLALHEEDADRIARRWLDEARTAAETARFELPRSRLGIEPGDVVEVDGSTARGRFRVDRIIEGVGREIEATRDVAQEVRIFGAAPPTAPHPTAGMICEPVATALIDATWPGAPDGLGPLLAVFAHPWPGAVSVWRSGRSDVWTHLTTLTRPAVMGEVVAGPPAAEAHRWGRGVGLEVALWGGSLSSRALADVLDGANLAAVETAAGWEIVQFARADLTGPSRWALSGMLRGQSGGVERGMTGPGRRFVLLDGALERLPWREDEVGLSRRLRIGPAHRSHDHECYVEIEAATQVSRRRPLPPCQLRMTRSGDDIVIRWARRSILDLDAWSCAEPPITEGSESYRLRILASGAVVRTVDVPESRFVYAESLRLSDGAAGNFEVRVAQVSDQWGPGPETGVVWNG